jgi:hypothetical protein
MWYNSKKTLIAAGAIFFIALSGCYRDKEDLLYGETNCEPAGVSYQNDIAPLISASCASSGCHVQGSNSVIFENYNNVKAKVDDGSFVQRVLVNGDMPPGTPLTDCQIAFIQQWIDNGAPND